MNRCINAYITIINLFDRVGEYVKAKNWFFEFRQNKWVILYMNI